LSIVEKSLQKYREARADHPPGVGHAVDPPASAAASLDAAAGSARHAGHNANGASPAAGARLSAGGLVERRRVPRSDPAQPRFFETLRSRTIAMDPAHLRSLELYPSVQSEAAIQDQFRRVKWPLLEMAIGRKAAETPNGRLILVTSCLADEGKTFCAVNLALSIARERDLSVVLVDGDVRKAHISRSLGIDAEPGLVELVEDSSLTLRDVCLRTSVPQLFLLPAGQFNEDVPEHWASARMQAIMHELSLLDRQSIVIMDSSPILLTNDTQVLTRLVGQVAFIVRANYTPRAVISEGLALVDRAPVVSCVLNQSAEAPADYYAYGGYPYAQGSRSAAPAAKADTSKVG
jgi:Mrp family chromosome partitioning ATPase